MRPLHATPGKVPGVESNRWRTMSRRPLAIACAHLLALLCTVLLLHRRLVERLLVNSVQPARQVTKGHLSALVRGLVMATSLSSAELS